MIRFLQNAMSPLHSFDDKTCLDEASTKISLLLSLCTPIKRISQHSASVPMIVKVNEGRMHAQVILASLKRTFSKNFVDYPTMPAHIVQQLYIHKSKLGKQNGTWRMKTTKTEMHSKRITCVYIFFFHFCLMLMLYTERLLLFFF